jgi:hypothetical protein
MNALVTGSHIGVTLVYTVTQLIMIFGKNKDLTQYYRMLSAFIFFGGVADVFLSVMLWFILDSKQTATIFMDGDRVYAV